MIKKYFILLLTVLSTSPPVYGALQQPHIQLASCAQCGKRESKAQKLQVCSRCSIAKYCSTGCQKAAWPNHKQTCRKQLDQTNAEGLTALILAVEEGSLIKCKSLVAAGASVNATSISGITPLLLAVYRGNETICKFLLENGADSNCADPLEATPLIIATQMGNLALCKLLLSYGAHILRASKGVTPLHCAAQNGHLSLCELFLTYIKNPDILGKLNITPLISAAENGRLDIGKLLLQHGANSNHIDNNGVTPLYIAAQNDHVDVCSLLLDNGADPNIRTNDGRTPLYTAATKGHENLCQILLERGANPNHAPQHGCTPLYVAAQKGHVTACKMLLAHQASVNQTSSDGATPLYIASHYGCSAVCDLLIQTGADITQGYNHYMPIYVAGWFEHLECLQVLYARHVSQRIMCNYKNLSLLRWLLQNNKYKSVFCLLKMGAFQDLLPEEQKAFIALAVQGWREDIIAFLYPDTDPAQFIVDHLCQHVFLLQESEPLIQVTQEKDYDDLPTPIVPVKPKSKFDEPLVAFDTAGPADNSTFTTVTKPTHDKTIIGTLSNRVSQWFVNPEQAWRDQGYCTPGHSKCTAPTEHDRVIMHHTFPRVIDLILSDAHCIFSDENETTYRLYGTITHQGKTEHGAFTYTVGENGCYHRSFSQRQKLPKGTMCYIPDTELIEKLKHHYSCKNLRIIPSKTGISIVDPTTQITYTVYCIKN